MNDESLNKKFARKLAVISANDGHYDESTIIEFTNIVHERDKYRDQQIALAARLEEERSLDHKGLQTGYVIDRDIIQERIELLKSELNDALNS